MRGEAAATIESLVDRVTVDPDQADGTAAPISRHQPRTAALFPKRRNPRRVTGRVYNVVVVVAGTGFEPVTFRL